MATVENKQAEEHVSAASTDPRPVRRTLTMDEACKVIGLPRSTGYELAASGRFPCRVLRIGRRWYVPTDAVEELLSGRAA